MLGSAVIVAAGLVAATGAPAAAADPAFAGMEGWGYVVARKATTALYTPTAGNQASSFGSASTVSRISTGVYQVRFMGFQTPAADIHVSALADTPVICSAGDRGVDGDDYLVQVACFERSGAPTDNRFTVNVVAFSTLQDDLGYVLATLPSTTLYQPADQYNSSQVRNTVRRTAKGRWTVTFPGLGGTDGRGSVVVTAAGASATVCRVTSWTVGLKAHVACRDRGGSLVDKPFNLAFLRDRGLKGPLDGGVAYLRINGAAFGRLTPAAGYWFSSSGRKPTIDHHAIGIYEVTLGGLPAGGSAQVSAYGSGDHRCTISSIRASGSPQKVTVRCFLGSGLGPADAAFTLSYTR